MKIELPWRCLGSGTRSPKRRGKGRRCCKADPWRPHQIRPPLLSRIWTFSLYFYFWFYRFVIKLQNKNRKRDDLDREMEGKRDMRSVWDSRRPKLKTRSKLPMGVGFILCYADGESLLFFESSKPLAESSLSWILARTLCLNVLISAPRLIKSPYIFNW